MDITVQPIVDDQLTYTLNHSKNGHYLKSHKSKSIEQLISLAHKELRKHDSDPIEYEDVTGQWNTDNDDSELNTYTLYIAIGPARIRYTDILASLDFDSNPLTKPTLGANTSDYKLKKVTGPTSSMIVSFLESFLLTFLGGIICLIGTNSYIKTMTKDYGTEYQVKDHLRKNTNK